MANTGNIFVQTGENNAGIGATAWSNPGNIVSDNATDATCAAAASSQYLIGRNCGFSIPSTAVIKGITVRAEASEHSAGNESLNASLQDDSGALIGNSKAATVNGTTKAVYTYGGTADLWGAALTPAIVNDPDFGVRFWFTTAHDVRVDYVTIAIEYSNAYTLSCDPGSFSLTGQNATLTVQRKLTAVDGGFSFSGQDAGITVQRKLTAEAGVFNFSGQDVTLRKGYTLTADPAVFLFTGQTTTLKKDSKLTAGEAGFSLTGQNSSLTVQRKLSADPGSFSFSGQNATILKQSLVITTAGSFAFTGQDATLTGSGGSYYGVLKRWNGTSWQRATIKVYTGTFTAKPLKIWTGSSWEEIDTTG